MRFSERNSKLTKDKLGSRPTDEESKMYDVNIRFVYTLRSIGVGQETGQVFAGVKNLPRQLKLQSLRMMEIETFHVPSMGAGSDMVSHRSM
ncbi:hypothetical protein J6590_032894, partial [Homalodisca vitripennis]